MQKPVMFWNQSEVSKTVSESEDTMQTIMDNCDKNVQYGLSLNKDDGNSRRFCSETVFETF